MGDPSRTRESPRRRSALWFEAKEFGGDGGAKRFEMGVERLSSGGGELNPGSGLPVEASFLDAHDSFFLQRCQILRQRGVGHFDDSAERLEVCSLYFRERRDDRQPDGGKEGLV